MVSLLLKEQETPGIGRRNQALFPLPNYTKFKDKTPAQLVNMFLDQDIYMALATKSNEYAMLKHGLEANITADEIRVFFGDVLSKGLNRKLKHTA